MKLVHDIFLDPLTFKLWKKCITDISNVLDIIFKKNTEHDQALFQAKS